MPEQHDAVALAAHLWRSPAAFRIHLRSQSMRRLTHWQERARELPDSHREALTAEVHYREARPQMRDGGWAE